MNTNTTNTTNNSNAVNPAIAEAPLIDNVPESPTSYLDVINMAINTIYTASRRLTIAETERVMDDLETLGMCINDMMQSRIPQDRLSMIDGKWYLTVTAEEGNAEAAALKFREILSASPLAALEGYASQMLAEATKEAAHLRKLIVDPFGGIPDAEDARELAEIEARRDGLSPSLGEIREAIIAHGGEAIANAVELHPATLDALFSIV